MRSAFSFSLLQATNVGAKAEPGRVCSCCAVVHDSAANMTDYNRNNVTYSVEETRLCSPRIYADRHQPTHPAAATAVEREKWDGGRAGKERGRKTGPITRENDERSGRGETGRTSGCERTTRFWANERPSEESFIRQTSIASPLTATETTKLSPDASAWQPQQQRQQQPSADGLRGISVHFLLGFIDTRLCVLVRWDHSPELD